MEFPQEPLRTDPKAKLQNRSETFKFLKVLWKLKSSIHKLLFEQMGLEFPEDKWIKGTRIVVVMWNSPLLNENLYFDK